MKTAASNGANIPAMRDYGALLVRRAANTNNPPSGIFTTDDLLRLVGFDQADLIKRRRNAEPTYSLILGDAAWDHETGGGLALRSTAVLNENRELISITMGMTTIHPTGVKEEAELFALNLKSNRRHFRIDSLRFAGHELDITRGELIQRALGAMGAINNALQARSLPEPIASHTMFPDIGRIVGKTYGLAAEIGDQLRLSGVDLKGGFNFLAEAPSLKRELSPLSLPKDVAPLLFGIGQNDLNPHRKFDARRYVVQADPQHGGLYRCEAELGTRELKITINLLSPGQEHTAREVAHITWQVKATDIILTKLDCMGEDCLGKSVAEQQKILGIVNATLQEIRERRYPKIADLLALHNQQGLLDQKRFTYGEITADPQMAFVVLGGAQPREIMPGFGGDIGGNATGIMFTRRLQNGRISRAYFQVDAGVMFCKLNDIVKSHAGNWQRAMPYIVPFLRDIQGFILTHIHEDHTGAVIDYSMRGLLKDIPCCATSFVCRVMRTKLKKARVPENLWPVFTPVDEPRFIDLVDADGILGSVYFMPRMFRHSTENSGIIAAPAPYRMTADGKVFDKSIKLNPNYWELLLTGDVAFGEICLPGYQGELPPDLGFKRQSLADYRVARNHRFPLLTKADDKLRGSMTAITEGTSIHRSGFAPHVIEVFRNQNRIRGWFPNLGELNAILSTATNAIEMAFWKATHHGLLLTAAGSYLEDRIRDMNMAGVNFDVLPPTGQGGENNRYLEFYAALNGLPPTQILDRSSKTIREALVDDPTKVLMLITGTQNTVIEKDAVAIQIAQLRSFIQADPKWRRAGLGMDIRQFLIGFLQAAIPGNEESQLQLIRELCSDLDVTVYAAVHNGTQFFNVKEPIMRRMRADLDQWGIKYRIMGAGEIYIHDFPVYAPGHMWREDARQILLPWLKENGVSRLGMTHYNKDYNVQVGRELAAGADLDFLPQLFDHDVYTATDFGRRVRYLGRVQPAYVLGRENRRPDLYHGGVDEQKVMHILQADGSDQQAGLNLAQSRIYLSDFGVVHDALTQHQTRSGPVRRRDEMSQWWITEAPANDAPPVEALAGMIFDDIPRSPFAGLPTLRERQNRVAVSGAQLKAA